MRTILITAAALTVIAMPAFAQSFDPDVGTGNILPFVSNQGGASAYARVPDYDARYSRAQTVRRMHQPAHRAHGKKIIHREDGNE
ncbi:MAG TPA: hypothetical protein VIY07_05615 [Pseudolabrys sp.]